MPDQPAPTTGERGAAPDAKRLPPVGITIEEEPMFLHFSALGEVLTQMHHLPPELWQATRTRLSYFQMRGFPLADPKPGKARLGMDDTLKVVFAFELLRAGQSPQRAMRLTRTDWTEISTVIATAWRHARAGRADAPLLAISPDALSEMAADDLAPNKPLSEVIGAVTLEYAVGALAGRATLLLDVGRMALALEQVMDAPRGERLRKTMAAGDFARAMDAYAIDLLGRDAGE